jgi:predicted GNAT superfamily acetyltransferase
VSNFSSAQPSTERAIGVRKCTTLEEFRGCVALQREIWAEADLEIEPATMFVVASHTGGQVLGAFDGEKLVGYTLAVVGLRHTRPYLHSHHTGVHADYRDRGVGRSLKLFQREEALGRGIRLIEWTFDRIYRANLYGVTTSPLHRGLATDRLVAEWYLDSPRVIGATSDIANEPVSTPATIELPAELERSKLEDTEEVRRLQQRIREEFTNWFARGYAAIGTRKTATGTAYVLAPWSDF